MKNNKINRKNRIFIAKSILISIIEICTLYYLSVEVVNSINTVMLVKPVLTQKLIKKSLILEADQLTKIYYFITLYLYDTSILYYRQLLFRKLKYEIKLFFRR